MNKTYEIIKRAIDLIASLVGLIITFPILLIISILIKFDSKGPVLFKQERIGENGKKFIIYKFRSMVVNEQAYQGFSVASDNRITNVGKFIRKFKLDELPQLINVFKGDMSLVGPRPYVYNDFKYNKEEELKVLDGIKPGITGLASFVYKNENYIIDKAINKTKYYREIHLKNKSNLNLEYKKYRSLWVDFQIILATCNLKKGVRLYKEGNLYVPANVDEVILWNKQQNNN